MACPCCDKSYCVNVPCSKYGLLQVQWAGMTETQAIFTSPSVRLPQTQGIRIRYDESCWYPPGVLFDGVPHGGFYGVGFLLSFGTPVTGLGFSYLANPPFCTESNTEADGFTVSGIVVAGLQAYLGDFKSFPRFQFYIQYHYTSDKESVRITQVDDVIGLRDFRDGSIGRYPPLCGDLIDAANAFKSIEPSLSLVQTGTGTRCSGLDKDSRGFPAARGPYFPSTDCAADCENPLP